PFPGRPVRVDGTEIPFVRVVDLGTVAWAGGGGCGHSADHNDMHRLSAIGYRNRSIRISASAICQPAPMADSDSRWPDSASQQPLGYRRWFAASAASLSRANWAAAAWVSFTAQRIRRSDEP